jgi:thiamine pyrophosphate-dependent acetolactate synthase large subunit-like protein
MNRFDLTKRLVAKLQRGEAVIGGIGNTNFDLWPAGQRPENFYMLGSMGLAVPIGVGVALAQPARRTFVLEGDGSLLMQLGALGTVAATALRNLTIIAFDNGMYHITGKQKSLTASTVDLVAVAKGAGLAQSEWARDEAHFEALIDRALAAPGPWFIGARIDAAKPAGVTERDAALIRRRFMAAIAPKA